jgi:hypothetical protein
LIGLYKSGVENIVRIGGRSTSTILEQFNLKSLKRGHFISWEHKNEEKEIYQDIQRQSQLLESLLKIHDSYLDWSLVKEYLQVNAPSYVLI